VINVGIQQGLEVFIKVLNLLIVCFLFAEYIVQGREMKILSPRENLYTKLPEVRAPLLPTRDPTSPLPPPPPVPAALVPGVERVVAASHPAQSAPPPPEQLSSPVATTPAPPAPAPAAMSNTLTQHLLNMLSDPISTYSEQISESVEPGSGQEDGAAAEGVVEEQPSSSDADLNLSDDEYLSPLLRKACVLTDNGVRVDVVAATAQRASAGKKNMNHFVLS